LDRSHCQLKFDIKLASTVCYKAVLLTPWRRGYPSSLICRLVCTRDLAIVTYMPIGNRLVNLDYKVTTVNLYCTLCVQSNGWWQDHRRELFVFRSTPHLWSTQGRRLVAHDNTPLPPLTPSHSFLFLSFQFSYRPQGLLYYIKADILNILNVF